MADKPNILIIHTDQHRCDCLGAYGNAEIRTPHIDQLATDGVRYDNSFCPSTICSPSRYSLITGLYTHQHLGWDNRSSIPGGLETFPRLLSEAGFTTAAVGKMHYTPTYLDVGFQQMCLSEQDGPGRFDDDYHQYLMDRGLVDGVDLMDQVGEYHQEAPPEYYQCLGAVESDLPEEHHSTTWIADRAMEQLDTWKGGGNLLMVGFIKPHHPFDPPAPWSQAYDPESLSLLPGWSEDLAPQDRSLGRVHFDNRPISEAQMRRVMAHYYGSISQIDHQVGRMLEALRRKRLYEDALVIFTSDHGEYLGYHNLLLKLNHMYDPLMRVPLIAKYPRGTRAGPTDDRLVSTIDVAPTILGQVGCERGQYMEGLDLAQPGESRDLVFAEELRHRPAYMVRSHERKLVLHGERERSLFFDLEQDPCEMQNRFDDPSCQAEISSLVERLQHWSLFESMAPICLDEGAPTRSTGGRNACDLSHRPEREAYFRRKMSDAATVLFGR